MKWQKRSVYTALFNSSSGMIALKRPRGAAQTVIREVPELQFFDQLPAAWDDTKVLEGYPREYIAIARKNGNDWFIGCITGNKIRAFRIDLSFLPKGMVYNAVIIMMILPWKRKQKRGSKK